LCVAVRASAVEKRATVAKNKSVLVASVVMAARDGDILAFVELEFLRSDFVVFAGDFAGEDFVGDGAGARVGRLGNVVGDVCGCESRWFEIFFLFVAPFVAAGECFGFREGIIILRFGVVVREG